MGFSRKLQWLIFGVILFSLLSGCGDLEPEMQDTRTVILNMDFHKKSSSRSSSSVSAAELSNYKTHLVMAQPSEEYLSSSYLYPKSLAEGLMDPVSRKITLEIPLNTNMKIFAFLFKENYSHYDLFSAKREAGYYGDSQSFTIGSQTDSLRLNIRLTQVPGANTDTPTELEGTWVESCHASGSYFRINSLTVSGTNSVETNDWYSDSSCTNKVGKNIFLSESLSIGNNITLDNGGTVHKFTTNLSDSTYTSLSSDDVSWCNTNSYCGLTNWELNTPQSIAGKTCGSSTYFSKGITVYGVYKLDGSKLFFRASKDDYPTAVPTNSWNKQ